MGKLCDIISLLAEINLGGGIVDGNRNETSGS